MIDANFTDSFDGTTRPVIFVCGCMRSGTTLLHKVICTSPDTNPFINASRYLSEQLQIYLRYAGSDHLFTDDSFGDVEGLRRFTSDIIDRFLIETWDRNGRPKVLVLKNVELSFYVPALADLVPNSRFVFSMREPKDTITSIIRAGNKLRQNKVQAPLAAAGRDLDILCRMYNNHYAPALQNLGKPGSMLKDRVLFARYEDLVTQTRETVDATAAFCGIQPGYPPESGEWRASDNTRKSAAHLKWRSYLTELSSGPISADSLGAYRTELSEAECTKIDETCQAIRKTFHYS